MDLTTLHHKFLSGDLEQMAVLEVQMLVVLPDDYHQSQIVQYGAGASWICVGIQICDLQQVPMAFGRVPEEQTWAEAK